MLIAGSLSFDYYDKELLAEINFSIKPGDFLYLQGKNGSGKTTLLKLLAGISKPQAGSILWDKTDIQDDLAGYQANLCYVGHKSSLNPLLSVRENYFLDTDWECSELLFDNMTKLLAMSDFIDKPCQLLSQGQRKRASLLRVMLKKAKLWLLDEPLAALDQASIEIMLALFKEHIEKQGMIIMSSHQSFSLGFDYQRYSL